MAAKASRIPAISLPTLGGLNERVSPANLRPGEWAVLNGLYPNLVGSLSRIPGKVMLANPGETIASGQINQIWPTYNSQQDVLVQTEGYILRYTLDELLGRSTTPNLIIDVNPLEESMSYALIIQSETNNTNGGSIDGVFSGSSTATANTFYGSRLTEIPCDADSIIVAHTFSGAQSSSPSTAGAFSLASGTYRITAQKTFVAGTTVVSGIWNVDDSAFVNYAGGTTPMTSMAVSGQGDQAFSLIEGRFTLSGTKSLQFRSQVSNFSAARGFTFCGAPYAAATATMGGAAPKEIYTIIKILKEPT